MPNQYVSVDPAVRFWSKVNKQGPKRKRMKSRCWVWTGGCLSAGYGHFWFEGKTVKAHRAAWFFEHGEWPMKPLHHLCHRESCVRPSHLRQMSYKKHNDTHKKKRCKRGHKLSGKNVWINPAGARVCIECKRMHGRNNERARRARLKAEKER